MCPTDLLRPDEPRVLAERLRSAAKGLDVLVHAAGTIGYGEVESTPPAELDEQYRIHVRAPYVLTQELLPQLRAREGQVVFVNSTAALASRARITHYAAAKAAQKALADGLRGEVNQQGIRVLSVYAGRTATPMQEAFSAMEGREYVASALVQPADVAATVLSALALPRTAEVTEVFVRPMRKPR